MNDLKWPEMTYNNLKQARNDLKQNTTIYNQQEMTWNDLQWARNNLKQPAMSKTQPTMTWTYLQQATASKFSGYFTIWGKRFSSLPHFPPNIWLQSFKHHFTENHRENRTSSIYYHVSSVNYHVYFLQDIRFIFFCLGFLSAGKGRGCFFSSSLPFLPALENCLVFIICIYQRGLMMNKDFASRSGNRTTFFYYQNLYKSK